MNSFIFFLILIGVLIFVHELGHFLMGKLLGVKVLTFSLGFPPKLIGKRFGETEYVIGAIPLGGYVRFLGEDSMDEVPKEEYHRAFHLQPFWKKSLIVVLGPLMNLTLPLFIYFVTSYESRIEPPMIGTVLPGSPAEKAGIMSGDQIIEIDGKAVAGFNDMRDVISKKGGKKVKFVVLRDGKRIETMVEVEKQLDYIPPLDIKREVGRIGILSGYEAPLIQVPDNESLAFRMGLRTGDLILRIGDKNILKWSDIENFTVKPGLNVTIDLLRPGKVNVPGGNIYAMSFQSIPVSIPSDFAGRNFTAIGVDSTQLYIQSVTAGSPADNAGIRVGDKIVKINGHEVKLWAEVEQTLKSYPDSYHEFTVRKPDGAFLNTYLKMNKVSITDDLKQETFSYTFGAFNFSILKEFESIPNPDPVAGAIKGGIVETFSAIKLTILGIVRIIQGRISIKTLGGPIMIYDLAGKAAKVGAESFLRLMALVSISLGIINLVPIPMLDGGLLLLFVIEFIIRRSPGEKFRMIYQYVGFAIIGLLIILVFKNDIERYWDTIANFFGRGSSG